MLPVVDDRRWKYNFDVIETRPGRPHCVTRENLYDDVINLYSKSLASVLQESPFRISFTGEKAIDVGGVSRDMFSSFWDKAYLTSFDGGNVLTPAMHPGIDTSVFSVLATILSHGFLSCGFLPIRIAFPVLAAIVLGPTIAIPEDMIIESFADYLSAYESDMVSKALHLASSTAPFSEELVSKLIEILSRMGCCEIPNTNNFRRMIAEVAKFTFITKCMGHLYALHSGIPAIHHAFWKELSVDELYRLYQVLVATPQRVLSLLVEPECLTAAEARVFGYLTMFIGDLKRQELSSLIRFITGSSVLVAREITVSFNSLSGLARRPIGHTCPCMLELSTSYCSYQEFANEFIGILRNDLPFVWAMDAF